jgi:hypothetical protein
MQTWFKGVQHAVKKRRDMLAVVTRGIVWRMRLGVRHVASGVAKSGVSEILIDKIDKIRSLIYLPELHHLHSILHLIFYEFVYDLRFFLNSTRKIMMFFYSLVLGSSHSCMRLISTKNHARRNDYVLCHAE